MIIDGYSFAKTRRKREAISIVAYILRAAIGRHEAVWYLFAISAGASAAAWGAQAGGASALDRVGKLW